MNRYRIGTSCGVAFAAVLLPVLAFAESEPAPSLVFSTGDVPRLRESVAQEELAAVWQDLRTRADRYCDPASSGYADPQRIDEAPANQVRIQILGHTFGRRLTRWVEDVGLAYQITGDQRYGKHGAAILMEAVARLPVTDSRLEKSFAGARGDIARGLAMGYDWLGELLTEPQQRQWAEVAAGYVRNILGEAQRPGTWWVPHHNFMGVAGGAAGCLALKLEPFYPDEAPGWVADCERLMRSWLDEGFDDQGAYYEGTLYSIYGLTNATLFAEALQRSGGPDLFQHPKLLRVPHFLALSLLPGERVLEARNDANYGGITSPLVLLMAQRQPSPLANWLWDRCGESTEALRIVWHNDVPARDPIASGVPLGEHFQGRGLCVFRTGWEREDVLFSVEAGPFKPVTHNQADKGSFTLYGLGQRWAIDSGYGNNREPEGRDQTVAHNCILVDGQGQALSGAGAGTNGRILAYHDSPDYGYCLADATEAYNRNNHKQPGAVVRHAHRHALFLRPRQGAPPYAIVLDDIEKDDQERAYTWLLHTAPNTDIELSESAALLRPAPAKTTVPSDAAKRPRMVIRFAAAAPVALEVDTYDKHPRLKVTAQTRNPRFAAVLLPLPADSAEPHVSFTPESDGRRLRIQWPGAVRDEVFWPVDTAASLVIRREISE